VIPAGGAAIVEFTVQVPGTYILVDHSLFRAFNKGALAMLKVDGPEHKDIYSGREIDSVYLGDKASPSTAMGTAAEKAAQGTLTKADQIAAGKQLFLGTCSPCHQPEGQGVPNAFPPLAGSDFLMSDKARAIGIVLNGRTGPITVSGRDFNSVMPPLSQLPDDDIANILTFVRNSWGNSGDAVATADVATVRKATPRPPGAAN
jgi:nitrite reductase (NO-forming)